MRLRVVPLLLLCALAVSATACGAEEEQPAAPPGAPAEPAPEDEDDDGPEPVGEWTWDTLASDDFPREEGLSYLVDVRASPHAARTDHPAFDRIVLEFEGDEAPSWRVAPEEPPIVEDPSGLELEVAGEAFIRITLHPASGVDLTDDEAVPRYEGPDRIPVDGAVVTELALVTDHHGAVAWVVGLTREAPFAVALLSDPPRLVVDLVDD